MEVHAGEKNFVGRLASLVSVAAQRFSHQPLSLKISVKLSPVSSYPLLWWLPSLTVLTKVRQFVPTLLGVTSQFLDFG